MNDKLKDILLNSLSFFLFQVMVLLAFKWNNKQNVNIDYSTLAALAIGGIVFGILMNLFLVKEILEKIIVLTNRVTQKSLSHLK